MYKNTIYKNNISVINKKYQLLCLISLQLKFSNTSFTNGIKLTNDDLDFS